MPSLFYSCFEVSAIKLFKQYAEELAEATKDYRKVAIIDCQNPEDYSIDEVFFNPKNNSKIGGLDLLLLIPKIRQLQKSIVNYILANKVDMFIGFDAPFFHLSLYEQIKKVSSCKIVHFVSPTFWFIGKNRMHRLGKTADAIFCYFPFEQDLYQQAGYTQAHSILHPSFFSAPPKKFYEQAKVQIAQASFLKDCVKVGFALGSRKSEIQKHAVILRKVIATSLAKNPNLVFVSALNEEINGLNQALRGLKQEFTCKLLLLDAPQRCVFAACDILMIKSGTTSLDALLEKKPMLVFYAPSFLTLILAHILRLKHRKFYKSCISFPNLLRKPQMDNQQTLPGWVPEHYQLTNLEHFLDAELSTLLKSQKARQQQIEAFEETIAYTKQAATKNQATSIILRLLKA